MYKKNGLNTAMIAGFLRYRKTDKRKKKGIHKKEYKQIMEYQEVFSVKNNKQEEWRRRKELIDAVKEVLKEIGMEVENADDRKIEDEAE